MSSSADLSRSQYAATAGRHPGALWFGEDGPRCFGMLHEPELPSTRGVVFCNALGLEGLLAHPAFLHMATDLAARGFWALRFDYDGEGDSAGGPWEPGRVDAWMASIDAAVGVLRARGVTDVRLVGFRIGASLAHRYATTRPGVSGLVLWSPCVTGAAYVREVRALSRLSSVARPVQHIESDWFPKDSMEVVGFELAAGTLRDLAEIDLMNSPGAVLPPDVLLIDRDDAPPNDALAARLIEQGARVEHDAMPGYQDFVTDGAESSVLPRPILARIEQWLDASAPAIPAPLPPAGRSPRESAQLAVDNPGAGRLAKPGPARDGVVEETTWIDGRFFAVVSRPAGTAPIRRASIVLCNTGANSRIGPGRLYVGMARYWAGLGFTVVRVDLGGCGDSALLDGGIDMRHLSDVTRVELQAVLTAVRTLTGFDRVVVCGLCSGAFHAFQVAVRGLPIDHLLLVNPGTFYLEGGMKSDEVALASANFLTLGFANGRKWRMALTDREMRRRGVRSVRELFRRGAFSGLRVLFVGSLRNGARRVGLPVRDSSVLARDLAAMIARGVHVLIVFASDESAARYLRTVGGPACATLAARDGLDIVDIEGGDHIFSPPGARQRLIKVLTEYLQHEYALAPWVESPGKASDQHP